MSHPQLLANTFSGQQISYGTWSNLSLIDENFKSYVVAKKITDKESYYLPSDKENYLVTFTTADIKGSGELSNYNIPANLVTFVDAPIESSETDRGEGGSSHPLLYKSLFGIDYKLEKGTYGDRVHLAPWITSSWQSESAVKIYFDGKTGPLEEDDPTFTFTEDNSMYLPYWDDIPDVQGMRLDMLVKIKHPSDPSAPSAQSEIHVTLCAIRSLGGDSDFSGNPTQPFPDGTSINEILKRQSFVLTWDPVLIQSLPLAQRVKDDSYNDTGCILPQSCFIGSKLSDEWLSRPSVKAGLAVPGIYSYRLENDLNISCDNFPDPVNSGDLELNAITSIPAQYYPLYLPMGVMDFDSNIKDSTLATWRITASFDDYKTYTLYRKFRVIGLVDPPQPFGIHSDDWVKTDKYNLNYVRDGLDPLPVEKSLDGVCVLGRFTTNSSQLAPYVQCDDDGYYVEVNDVTPGAEYEIANLTINCDETTGTPKSISWSPCTASGVTYILLNASTEEEITRTIHTSIDLTTLDIVDGTRLRISVEGIMSSVVKMPTRLPTPDEYLVVEYKNNKLQLTAASSNLSGYKVEVCKDTLEDEDTDFSQGAIENLDRDYKVGERYCLIAVPDSYTSSIQDDVQHYYNSLPSEKISYSPKGQYNTITSLTFKRSTTPGYLTVSYESTPSEFAQTTSLPAQVRLTDTPTKHIYASISESTFEIDCKYSTASVSAVQFAENGNYLSPRWFLASENNLSNIVIPAVLATPSPHISRDAQGEYQLSWDKVEGAVRYYYRYDESDTMLKQASEAGTYSIGSQYTAQVKAEGDGGDSVISPATLKYLSSYWSSVATFYEIFCQLDVSTNILTSYVELIETSSTNITIDSDGLHINELVESDSENCTFNTKNAQLSVMKFIEEIK